MATPASLVFFGDSLTDNGNLFHLAGIPQPPYVNGIYSNGPTYAAPLNLPALLHLSSADFAYAGARALGSQPVAGTDINLSGQVDKYLKQPHAAHTVVSINIGSNDYLNYDPKKNGDPASYVKSVIQSIGNEVNALVTAGGVDEVILFNLPNPALAPAKAALTPAQLAGATAIVAGHNHGIDILAATQEALGIHTVVVDIARLQTEFTKDADTFGLKTTDIPFVAPDAQGVHHPTPVLNFLRPDQVAYFDEIHPSAAVHGVAAIFAADTLQSGQTMLFNGGAQVLTGSAGSDFVFTGFGNDAITSLGGNDTVFAGRGNDLVQAGDGNDLVAGGGGNDKLFGGTGSDVLAGNLGNDKLYGGAGADVLISGQGTDVAYGGGGNDVFIFAQDLQVAAHGVFNGGGSTDAVRVIVQDFTLSGFNPAAALVQGDILQFVTSVATTHHGSLATLGLTVNNIERVEIYIQSHATGAISLLTAAGAAAPHETAVVHTLLHSADLWGLL